MKIQEQNLSNLRAKRAFKVKKTFFIIFVELSFAKNCTRTESWPLSFKQEGLPKNIVQNKPICHYKTDVCELVIGWE